MPGEVGITTRIGVQGGVMGWDDPWQPEAASVIHRTGEGRPFASQDGRPSPEVFVALLRELGAGTYLHHVIPGAAEIDAFVDAISAVGLPFLLGNEYGNINGPVGAGTNRFDVPDASVRRAGATGLLEGLVYDETEHLQLHPGMYRHGARGHQWAAVDGLDLQASEDAVVEAVRRRCAAHPGVPHWSEQVFPIMYHALARGGMHPCPKILKEQFSSVQLCTALGAAREYGRKLGICVDLWGFDVGAWFTRVWGFPAHPPAELESALEIAWLMAPDLLYVENIDALARFTPGGFRTTEFGDVFRRFTRDFVPAHPRAWAHGMVDPDIVLIRSDDTAYGPGDHPYGNEALEHDYRARSPFRVFHLLSRGAIPADGITYFLPRYSHHSGYYPRTEVTLGTLPLEDGVGRERATATHTVFHPLNNLLVLDERADDTTLGNPGLIFLAGSRMRPACREAVEKRVRAGAVAVAARWLVPEAREECWRDGEGRWIVTDDFESALVRETVEPHLGETRCWMQRFGRHEVRFRNPSGDGITLTHEVSERK